MLSLPKETLLNYTKARSPNLSKHPICLAPFKSIYFGTTGYAGFCYRSIIISPETAYPAKTIKEIWQSSPFQDIRKQFLDGNMPGICKDCYAEIIQENFSGALPRVYDNLITTNTDNYLPTLVELEFSNTCNLECIMCRGELSCNVREYREQDRPLAKVYDQEFITQFTELIPSLKEAKFLGGEPMLIPEYLDLWKNIVAINPNTAITITTNGTIQKKTFLELIPRGNFNIIVSLDSLQPENYARIRKNASLNETLQHIYLYRDILQSQQKALQISFCPMTVNWQEMPDLIEWGNKNSIVIWFHTVIQPKHLSLFHMPQTELQLIIEKLRAYKFTQDTTSSIATHNIQMYNNYIDHVLTPSLHGTTRN